MSISAGEKHYLHKERLDENRIYLRSGGKNPKKGNRLRKIHQIDYNTNEIIHTFDNAEDARVGMKLSDKQISSLLAVCTGRYEHYKGFKWKFEDDNQIKLNQNEQERA
jgi:regulator of RNase E activity RraB